MTSYKPYFTLTSDCIHILFIYSGTAELLPLSFCWHFIGSTYLLQWHFKNNTHVLITNAHRIPRYRQHAYSLPVSDCPKGQGDRTPGTYQPSLPPLSSFPNHHTLADVSGRTGEGNNTPGSCVLIFPHPSISFDPFDLITNHSWLYPPPPLPW